MHRFFAGASFYALAKMQRSETDLEDIVESRFISRLSPSWGDPRVGQLSRASSGEGGFGLSDERFMGRSWSGWVPNHALEPTATAHGSAVRLGFQSASVAVLACLSGGCGSAWSLGTTEVST